MAERGQGIDDFQVEAIFRKTLQSVRDYSDFIGQFHKIAFSRFIGPTKMTNEIDYTLLQIE